MPSAGCRDLITDNVSLNEVPFLTHYSLIVLRKLALHFHSHYFHSKKILDHLGFWILGLFFSCSIIINKKTSITNVVEHPLLQQGSTATCDRLASSSSECCSIADQQHQQKAEFVSCRIQLFAGAVDLQ